MNNWTRDLLQISPLEALSAEGTEAASRQAVSQALRLKREIRDFEARWPEPQGEDPMAPAFSWAELERQLADLTDCPVKSQMARELVSATRKMAAFKPREMVLREILCLAWVLLDEDFQPDFSSQA